MRIQSITIYRLPITNYHGASGTISTTVECALQIHLFMQNKPNFRKSQMNVSPVITMNYEQRTMNYEIKNKPNSNPKQTQNKPKTNPKQTQNKPKTNPKQTQNKPNTKPIQSQYKANTKPIQSQYKANTKPIQSQYKAKTNPISIAKLHVFTPKNLKKTNRSHLFKKLQKFSRIFLHYYAYYDILLHISEDVALCS
jgi:flagellar biosynthesis GTPase FlhF